MKKLIGLFVFGLVIVALSAPADAQIEWKASGFMDSNFHMYRNAPARKGNVGAAANTMDAADQPGEADSKAPTRGLNFNKEADYFNARGRLKLDAVMGKAASGTMFFEMDSKRWGELTSGRDSMGKIRADETAVEIKNFYIDFALPYFGVPVPMTARVGVQPFVIRQEVLESVDAAGVTLGFKMDPVTITPGFGRLTQGKDAQSDNTDRWSLHGLAKVGKLTIGAYGLFYNMRTYPLTAVSFTGANIDPSFKGKMYWFGAYADGMVGPVKLNTDFVYDYGKVKPQFVATTAPDVKYKGWVGRLGLALPWEMFEFGVYGMYASGADMNKTSSSGLPGSTVGNGSAAYTGQLSYKVGSYVIPPGSENYAGNNKNGIGIFYSQPLVSRSPDYTSDSASQLHRGSLGGTWFAKLHASYKFAPWYKFTLLGGYIGDTTRHGNTIGNARKADGLTLRDDKAIGWEAGVWNEIQIYKNLNMGVGAAWLWAKRGLDQAQFTGSGTFVRNVSPKDPYWFGTGLNYSF